jgi:5'-3' exoribonuclease 2
MLALATHEPHFKVLREDVFASEGTRRGCFICGKEGHIAEYCPGSLIRLNIGKSATEPEPVSNAKPQVAIKPFVLLHVNIFREYMELELKTNDTGFGFDLERAIDDWVFLCYFVGNDFLPHLPSLEIREGAIDTLTELWKKILCKMGGYLTEYGSVRVFGAKN